jgi:DDE superfamily endonuclease
MSFLPSWNKYWRQGSSQVTLSFSTIWERTRWMGRELIEKCGASVLYLPPNSLDFNPIEHAWSKLKQLLRGIKARLLDQLEPALAKAIDAITPQDAQAFFRHCGYRIQ